MKCMQLIQINTEHDDDDYEALSHIVHEMQVMPVFRYSVDTYLSMYMNEVLRL